MDAQLGKQGAGGHEPNDPEVLERAYASILRACSFAGLAGPEADDVAQDLFLWLVQSGLLAAAVSAPWVAGSTRNFIRRYWRARLVRNQRETRGAVELAIRRWGSEGVDDIDARLSFDRMERELPLVEAKLLHLVRRGLAFQEAGAALGIPHGSHNFFRRRLMTHLAEGLKSGAVAQNRPSRRRNLRAPTAKEAPAAKPRGR